MKDLGLTDAEISLIAQMCKEESVSIIWDINAFYFNTADSTFKLECIDDSPDGSDFEFDEIFFCRFTKLKNKLKFKEGNHKYWYKIISTNASIQSIDIIEVFQKFPGDYLLNEIDAEKVEGVNKVCLGLILVTNAGVVPAFLLPSNHGFSWQDKFAFYEFGEVEELLENEVKTYLLKPAFNKE